MRNKQILSITITKTKQLQETKIYYSKEQANIKYYNAKVFLFSKTYTYLINKLEHMKFIMELDSERPIHGHQVNTAHFYVVK